MKLKIAVCIKQVPSTSAPLQLDAGTRWLKEGETTFETNAADNHALEAALAIRDQLGGEVVVLTLGPERATEALREALAKGADRAIHLVSDQAPGLDPATVASLLASALAGEPWDLILCGLQSDDLGHGQTGAFLAEKLSLPQASIAAALEVTAEGQARVKRELEGGWYQWLELATPCLVTIQSGINKPRYAGMKGMLAAKKKPIVKQPVTEYPAGLTRQSIDELYYPHKAKQTRMLEGSPEAVATQLVAALNLRARP
ncbi:MAG TPA: electron transfer flavoprotein subunit beta/FixA family protein [Thiobacillaceae bacterium]|nr:electron transfer flavoprotein subunit beta/FixA family protein [Thiobacillaceae bacterium]HNF87831.1 electron transfer flavoprotein subunit beta/FixA family protein [Thiobacillaceae bacterium]HNH87783.1 electron transfer flavoprotein subunit beta/FixA family protein [Thiobacillaceae bacterium]HNI06501.1 electron transfer flavoprotein subunit beta/FixA family protein [Thiobacillaceae bacterium]